MIAMEGIWHTSFTVADLDRSLRFYVELLGLRLAHRQIQDNPYTRRLVAYADARLEVAMLEIPGFGTGPSGHHLELVQYLAPAGAKADVRTANVGAAHLAFVVSDLPRAYETLGPKGVRFKSAPVAIEEGRNRGGFSVYFLDPDDITLEMVQPPVVTLD